MGVDHYLLFIFKRSPSDLLKFLKRSFTLRLDERHSDALGWARIELENLLEERILERKIELAHGGYLWLKQLLSTVRGKPLEGGDFRLYQRGIYSVLEFHPNPRSLWPDVYSHELIEFLKVFIKEKALLITGYQDDIELDYLGLKEDNYYLLIDRLIELLERGRLRVLPSAFSIVKKGLTKLDDGLYTLRKRSPEEWNAYVLVKTVQDYQFLMRVLANDMTDDELYQEHFEDLTELSGLLTLTTLAPIAESVEDKWLLKRAGQILRVQTGR